MDRVTPGPSGSTVTGEGQSRLCQSGSPSGRRGAPWFVIYFVGPRPFAPRLSARRSIMRALHHFETLPEPHHDASQFALLPRMLAYASGLTSDFPISAHPCRTQASPKPSLKMRLLCIASAFGLVGTSIFQPTNVDSYFGKESPVAKTGLLANIGPNGTKSSGAKVHHTTPAYCIH
jgi:hypothetical protein